MNGYKDNPDQSIKERTDTLILSQEFNEKLFTPFNISNADY